jgi:hypothetical protein
MVYKPASAAIATFLTTVLACCSIVTSCDSQAGAGGTSAIASGDSYDPLPQPSQSACSSAFRSGSHRLNLAALAIVEIPHPDFGHIQQRPETEDPTLRREWLQSNQERLSELQSDGGDLTSEVTAVEATEDLELIEEVASSPDEEAFADDICEVAEGAKSALEAGSNLTALMTALTSNSGGSLVDFAKKAVADRLADGAPKLASIFSTDCPSAEGDANAILDAIIDAFCP